MSTFASEVEKGMENHCFCPETGQRFQDGHRAPLPNILPSSNPLSFPMGDLRENSSLLRPDLAI